MEFIIQEIREERNKGILTVNGIFINGELFYSYCPKYWLRDNKTEIESYLFYAFNIGNFERRDYIFRLTEIKEIVSEMLEFNKTQAVI